MNRPRHCPDLSACILTADIGDVGVPVVEKDGSLALIRAEEDITLLHRIPLIS